jgi:hypothetical protein
MKGPILVCKLNYSDSTKEFSQTDIIKMLEIFIDNIFVMFGLTSDTTQFDVTSW